MKHLSRGLTVGLLVVATVVVTSGCVIRARARPVGVYYTTGEVYATAPMPPPRVEVVTVAPRSGYVWTRGHWHWNGGSWVWVSGRWVAPRSGYVWVAPSYVYRGGRHVYVGGGWRASGHVRGRAVVRPAPRPAPRRAPPPPAVGVQRSGGPPPPPAVGAH
jgi:hypothetical protein